MNQGFISLHRKLKDNWIYKRSDYLHWFIEFLFKANFKESKQLVDNEFITVKRSQFITSYRNLAKELPNCSIQKIRTFITLLKKDEIISTKTLKNLTRITICNYDSYQNPQHTPNTRPTHAQHTPNTFNNKVNNENNENNENKKSVLKRTKKRTPSFYLEFTFFKKQFSQLWFDEFLPLKKRKKASTTETQLTSQLKKISKLSNDDYNTALEILEKSINSGWPDFYPLNGSYQNKPRKNNPSGYKESDADYSGSTEFKH